MTRQMLAITTVILGAVLILTSLPMWMSPFLREEGDLAANALQVERAKEGRELLGPYSKYGFHHPGPVSYYFQALTEPVFAMFPTPLARHLAAQLLLNLVATACSIRLLQRAGLPSSVAGAGLFLLGLPLVFLGGGDMFMLASVWGPLVVVGPMVLFVVAMARLAYGDLVAAPFAAAGATFAWHNHLLTIPPLCVVSLLTGACLLRCRPAMSPAPRSRRGVALWASASLLMAAGLVPVMVEQVTGDPGNLTLIHRFQSEQAATTHPWSEIIAHVGEAFTDPLVVLLHRSSSDIPGTMVTVAIILTTLMLSWWGARSRPRAWRLVLGFAWTAIAVAAITARHAYGDLKTYLIYYVYGMVGVIWTGMALQAHDRWFVALAGERRQAVIGVCAAGFAVMIPWLLRHPVAAPPARDDVAMVLSTLAPPSRDGVHLALGNGERDGDLWARIPTFALALRRAGTHVTVDERFVIVCGEEMRTRGDDRSQPTLLFTRTAPGPGQGHYARVADWGVFLIPADSSSTR